MKLFITGGAGFIGSNLAKHALHMGYKVVNLDKLTYAGNLSSLEPISSDPNYAFVHGDLCDHKLLDAIFCEHRPDAVLNLVLSAYTQPLAARMEGAFGVPYAPLHSAFTVPEIDRVYASIAETFGIQWGNEFDGWRNKAIELEGRARKELRGLRFVILPGVDMPAAVTHYLASFGMAPLLLVIEDFHNEDIIYAKSLKALGFDPAVCRMMNIDRDIEIVQSMKPDICIGGIPDRIESNKDFPVAEEMGDFFGVTGYERTVGLLDRLFTVLETGQTGGRMDMYGPAPL